MDDSTVGICADARWNLLAREKYTQAMKRVFVLLSFCFTLRAQNSSPDPQTLQSLLAEVHQLRVTMERSVQIAPRIQILVERLKLQHDQVARTSRQLEDLRHEMDRSRSDLGRFQQRLETIAADPGQATDPAKRRDLDEVSKMMKLEMEQTEKSLAQMQAHEGELTSQLQAEQNRLTELNDRLDQFERALNLP
jgi:predicted  nucleic acid-binding Zn-ribbon protein